MAKNRARKYIMLLRKKGWSDEDIGKFCHIKSPRLSYLNKIHAVPQRIEVDRLRGMMKRPTIGSFETVRSVWSTAYGDSSAEAELSEVVKSFSPTSNQLEVLKKMAKATRHGQAATVLERTDASIASRLRSKDITFVHEIEVGKRTVKRYGLTRTGLAACKAQGIAAEAVPSLDSLVLQASSPSQGRQASVVAASSPELQSGQGQAVASEVA